MKPPKLLFPSILLLLYTRLNLLPNVIGSKLPSTTSGNIESFPRSAIVSSRSELGAVGYKEDRHSRSASTAVGSYTAAASTTSAAQVSRRNDDLWYLEQSVVSYIVWILNQKQLFSLPKMFLLKILLFSESTCSAWSTNAISVWI